MDYNMVEPEEKDDVIDIDYNPLDEQVNEKKYSQPNINAQMDDLQKPIDEPRFSPPPLNKTPPPREEFKREPVNPEMKNLPKKEAQMAASFMAKVCLDGYAWIHTMANKSLLISEKKITKLQEEGEINLNSLIPYDYGKEIRVGEFIKEYNSQMESVLVVSDEFREEVTPVLERVLAKRGVALTDDQQLIFLFGKDLATKVIVWGQQKNQLGMLINAMKESASRSPQAQPQPQPQQESRRHQEQQQQQTQPEQQAEVVPQNGNNEKVKADIIVMPKGSRGRPKK